MMRFTLKGLAILAVGIALGCGKNSENAGSAGAEGAKGAKSEAVSELRLGYFPNVTHAQAVVGVQRGDFQSALGSDVKLVPSTYNAGPSVIEALFAGHLDIAYVGPSPTLNGFFQSKGEEVRVIAGSATNGVLIVGNKKRNFTKIEELRGKRIATPQLGNTQDISAKYYVVHTLGSKLKDQGGDTEVIAIANPDIEILFEKDQLDAAWVPEPWGTRLIEKGLGSAIIEERELWPNKTFGLTNVIARRAFLDAHPDLVAKFLKAHIKLTQELSTNAASFVPIVGSEIKRLTTKEIPESVITGSFKHVGFSVDPARESFQRFFEMGRELKLIRGEQLDIDKLIQPQLLNDALKESGGAKE